MPAKKPTTTQPRIAAATGAATSSRNRVTGAKIEAAMTQAIKDARAEGVNDPDVIRERMMEAREKAKQPA